MAKTILIPTDFSVRLLKLVFRAIEDNPDSQLRLLLVHRVSLSDSITDMLFYSKKKLLQSLETKEFKESCNIILSRYEKKIESLKIELFSGFNSKAFQNFLEGNEVDEIYSPLNYSPLLKHSCSLDILPLLSNTKVEMTEVDMKSATRTITNQIEELSDLFFQPVANQSI